MPNEGYAGGHVSMKLDLWRHDGFDVTYRPDLGTGMVFLHIGSLSLVVTTEQWSALVAAVDSVLPKAEVA